MNESLNRSFQLFQLAAAHHQRGDLTTAYQQYLEAVRIDHRIAGAWSNLGCILLAWKKWDLAVACCRNAVALSPETALFRMTLGEALWESNQIAEAKSHILQVLELDPTFGSCWRRLSNIYLSEGDTESALKAIDRAISLDSENQEAYIERSLVLLTAGKNEQGFREYEARIANEPGINRVAPPVFSCPRWHGEDLKGKTLILFGEQGLGDSIQFSRYLRALPKGLKEIIFIVPESLHRLFSYNFNDLPIQYIGKCENTMAVKADFFCLTMSLPQYLDVPQDSAYLTPPPIGPKINRPNNVRRTIGIVWAGNPNHVFDRHRSSCFEDFFSALSLPGVELYSLQSIRAEEDPLLLGPFGLVQDLRGELLDFADTAHAVSQLDVIVSVDTAVAHLAGALGKRCHLIIPGLPDWRWGVGRADTDWYPSIQIHRRANSETWRDVLQRVAAAELT